LDGTEALKTAWLSHFPTPTNPPTTQVEEREWHGQGHGNHGDGGPNRTGLEESAMVTWRDTRTRTEDSDSSAFSPRSTPPQRHVQYIS